MSKGKISIIVPVYSVAAELERCVESLIKQTYSDLEIILVDDGSPDECPIMCDAFAKKDSRIQVIHKENGGLSDARNKGLLSASGKYVLYVDADDYIELDACEKLISGFRDNVDFVVGEVKERRGSRQTLLSRTMIQPLEIYNAKDFIIGCIQNNEWYAPVWFNMYRREFLLDNALFFKVGYYFEDHQMLPRLYLAANKIVYVNYPFYNYVVRENSIMTSDNDEKKISDSIDIYAEWFTCLSDLKDKELQDYMLGILIRYYINNCKVRGVKGWVIPGMGFRFAYKHALNLKEQLRVVAFSLLFPIYRKL